MSDLKPPCDCIEKLGGCWRVVDCQCGNKDDYGDARAWCAEHNRPASLPVEALRALDERFDFTNPEATRRRLRELIDQAERREGS